MSSPIAVRDPPITFITVKDRVQTFNELEAASKNPRSTATAKPTRSSTIQNTSFVTVATENEPLPSSIGQQPQQKAPSDAPTTILPASYQLPIPVPVKIVNEIQTTPDRGLTAGLEKNPVPPTKSVKIPIKPGTAVDPSRAGRLRCVHHKHAKEHEPVTDTVKRTIVEVTITRNVEPVSDLPPLETGWHQDDQNPTRRVENIPPDNLPVQNDSTECTSADHSTQGPPTVPTRPSRFPRVDAKGQRIESALTGRPVLNSHHRGGVEETRGLEIKIPLLTEEERRDRRHSAPNVKIETFTRRRRSQPILRQPGRRSYFASDTPPTPTTASVPFSEIAVHPATPERTVSGGSSVRSASEPPVLRERLPDSQKAGSRRGQMLEDESQAISPVTMTVAISPVQERLDGDSPAEASGGLVDIPEDGNVSITVKMEVETSGTAPTQSDEENTTKDAGQTITHFIPGTQAETMEYLNRVSMDSIQHYLSAWKHITSTLLAGLETVELRPDELTSHSGHEEMVLHNMPVLHKIDELLTRLEQSARTLATSAEQWDVGVSEELPLLMSAAEEAQEARCTLLADTLPTSVPQSPYLDNQALVVQKQSLQGAGVQQSPAPAVHLTILKQGIDGQHLPLELARYSVRDLIAVLATDESDAQSGEHNSTWQGYSQDWFWQLYHEKKGRSNGGGSEQSGIGHGSGPEEASKDFASSASLPTAKLVAAAPATMASNEEKKS